MVTVAHGVSSGTTGAQNEASSVMPCSSTSGGPEPSDGGGELDGHERIVPDDDGPR